jgi:hypothetical protein
MPIVPPAVLYYGPPNMKVNPSDIKVMQQEDDFQDQYGYEDYQEDAWAAEFLQQYQDILQAPANHQPSSNQQHTPPLRPG